MKIAQHTLTITISVGQELLVKPIFSMDQRFFLFRGMRGVSESVREIAHDSAFVLSDFIIGAVQISGHSE